MKLPNGDRAQIDVRRKLIGYCLNKSHPTGKHKARVFEAVLGITTENVTILAHALRVAARELDAKVKSRSDDATKFEVELRVTGPRGIAVVRSGWVVERGSHVPRLATCYVKTSTRGSHGARS
jgi:hypothetical protein